MSVCLFFNTVGGRTIKPTRSHVDLRRYLTVIHFLNSLISERAQSCSCSIEISDSGESKPILYLYEVHCKFWLCLEVETGRV